MFMCLHSRLLLVVVNLFATLEKGVKDVGKVVKAGKTTLAASWLSGFHSGIYR